MNFFYKKFKVTLSKINKISYIVFFVFLLYLSIEPITLAVKQTEALKLLLIASNSLEENEQKKIIICSREKISNEEHILKLRESINNLKKPENIAKAYCLLGELDKAMELFDKAYQNGNVWAAMQNYFLKMQKGMIDDAENLINNDQITYKELERFHTFATIQNPDLDLFPLAIELVNRNPFDNEGWIAWLASGASLAKKNDWAGAIEIYNNGLWAQNRLGVFVGRSSFSLRLGRIYQNNVDPPQLKIALAFYDKAIEWNEYLFTNEKANIHNYRAEIYKGLPTEYTDYHVINEYNQALIIDSGNYWAKLGIAKVYLKNRIHPELAKELILESINLEPNKPDAYLSLGDYYFQQGNLRDAKLAYNEALLRRPDWGVILDRLSSLEEN